LSAIEKRVLAHRLELDPRQKGIEINENIVPEAIAPKLRVKRGIRAPLLEQS
jgi:hypothetical protein